mmetsp:Transcript_22017/g.18877  ORF Transcript_22017/g.18877 Transcript_22017/m.18877 type:complete len:90 (+) Transcript_22017:65-334(+)|eukprot:CAMPEP_0114589168 /NCGR_PEP_ID=MMETSP0125-20121206/11688_1 /TAXON_ID=485358 ORGANISM="Aristerostoma sp., Strain ATCC 50986" /NCGR_SAMPLE_ID=MMETSP0125 /ASSEMBLY_ACC=CAM_ASM_000245 /LENGTH=89 /DNA_ID=CAMNT_0001785929 /DNA_START=56 /DNA_END=325 /DNA_ORIENTATION=+
MLVNIEVIDEFGNLPKGQKFSVDTEYDKTIEDVKVLITLKPSSGLDPKEFDLWKDGKKLGLGDKLNTLGVKDGTLLFLKKKSGGCCSIF